MKNAAFVLVGLAFLTFLAMSCSDDSSVNGTDQNPELLRIVPDDGSSMVSTESSIHIAFNVPMDTSSVRMYMYFAGGEPMHEWMDSLDHYGGMGHMNMNRRNHMQNWIDSIEWGGEFHWNQNRDSCEFMPDSNLHPNTDYMIMIDENGMMGQNGRGMHMGHNDDGFHYSHFQTGGN